MMNRAEMLSKLKFRHARYGVRKQDVEDIFKDAFELIFENLLLGKEVSIHGFGVFKTEERAPRKGRNPRTGEVIEIPARRVVKFVPGKALRELVQDVYERKTWRSRRK